MLNNSGPGPIPPKNSLATNCAAWVAVTRTGDGAVIIIVWSVASSVKPVKLAVNSFELLRRADGIRLESGPRSLSGRGDDGVDGGDGEAFSFASA